ncbi:MAG: GYF domain-containing protein [Candidatus Pacebacteria bacterium]|nr:GYF domain-containing protein [Candidatus Paceibacterota bacterium]
MRNGIRWVIVDTETDGLYPPIHVVEIAAQVMVGWEPQGKPFRVFLNHGIAIPPEATAIHGYDKKFLKKHGLNPEKAHAKFADYVRGAPIASHNMSYDWNRALCPEWNRLGLQPAGRVGFCTMLLSRRVVHETKKHNLETLKSRFKIHSGRSHQALADVQTVVQLFSSVLAPRLSAAGLNTFDSICNFSHRTPIRKCLAEIQDASMSCRPIRDVSRQQVRDEWYALDVNNKKRGPFTAARINELAEGQPCYVWRDGMTAWAISTEVPEFYHLPHELFQSDK